MWVGLVVNKRCGWVTFGRSGEGKNVRWRYQIYRVMIHQEVLLFGIVCIAIHTTHITQTFSMTVVSLGTYEMKNIFS